MRVLAPGACLLGEGLGAGLGECRWGKPSRREHGASDAEPSRRAPGPRGSDANLLKEAAFSRGPTRAH